MIDDRGYYFRGTPAHVIRDELAKATAKLHNERWCAMAPDEAVRSLEARIRDLTAKLDATSKPRPAT